MTETNFFEHPIDYLKETFDDSVDFFAEPIFRGFAKIGDTFSLDETSKNIHHFLDGHGETIYIGRDKARKRVNGLVGHGETENRQRFENDFFKGLARNNDKSLKSLTDLKVGESTSFSDHYDVEFNTNPIKHDTKRNPFYADSFTDNKIKNSLDEFLATGKSELKTTGKFNALRVNDDEIHINGLTTNTWGDRYVFDSEDSQSFLGQHLQKNKKGTPFNTEATWKQHMNGTLKLKDGQIVDKNIEWWDAD